jgi:type IV pilus assembly protein PilC
MATAPNKKTPSRTANIAREHLFVWEGKDKTGKIIRGEMRAATETVVQTVLRRQGILTHKIRKQTFARGRKITDKDIALFTRQLSTMMRAGVPLLQSFDIAIKGCGNPSLARLLNDVRANVETGSNLSQAFRRHPVHFDALFCNLVAAGEQAGILDSLLDRLATYKEKILAIKGKIKSAMFYPIAVVVVAALVVSVMMLFVVPEFKKVFSSFGAELPAPTLFVIAISDFFVAYWYLAFGIIAGAVIGIGAILQAVDCHAGRRRPGDPAVPGHRRGDPQGHHRPLDTHLSTMFAAGVPLVEALDSVGGAAGNVVYKNATRQIQSDVSTGTSLTVAMQNALVFPTMVVQMVSIGEESGQLDSMLSKVADFFEQEVDDAVAGLSQLLEPIIMVFLGVVIGGLVVAMYLPIFKLGAVVG